MADIYDWSTTAADNDDADSTINWLEGQLPGTVNGSARAMMKRVKELLNDLGASGTVGGTADAITLTSAIATLATAKFVRFIAASTNTGAATLAVNGLTAKAIRKISGGTDVALTAGDIAAGETYTVIYRSTANSSAGGWVIVGSKGTVDLTGGQIKFPATQNASSDANTLDDYEEGTFNPTPGGTATLTTQVGRYVKVGKWVHCTIRMTVNSLGTGAAATILGLPFTSVNTTGYLAAGPLYWGTAAGSYVYGMVAIAANATSLTIYSTAAAATGLGINAVLQNSADVSCSIVYEASA